MIELYKSICVIACSGFLAIVLILVIAGLCDHGILVINSIIREIKSRKDIEK